MAAATSAKKTPAVQSLAGSWMTPISAAKMAKVARKSATS
jgi:hypothetical protein